MARRFRRRHSGDAEELNVTAFMNLMVVLVPFLLLSAVFSEITIHELNLPSLSEATREAKDDKPKVALEVIIRADRLEVQDRNGGISARVIANRGARHDFATLNNRLIEVKQSYPDITAVTLLLEPNVAYDTLISTMDAVRVAQASRGGETLKVELFPDMSIGDAPANQRGEGGQ